MIFKNNLKYVCSILFKIKKKKEVMNRIKYKMKIFFKI